MIDILEALKQQQQSAPANERTICNDGLLSVSDEVWERTYWSQFYDVPANDRHEFLEKVRKYDKEL